MVDSIRYWLKATRLINPDKEKGIILTDTAQTILKKDPYFEWDGTLFLIHYLLATNKESATTWYWFFNHFSARDLISPHWKMLFLLTLLLRQTKKLKITLFKKILTAF